MASIDDDILGLGVKVDLRQVEDALVRLRQSGENLLPVFRASRKDMRADQRDHARSEQGEAGHWPQLSPWTAAKRMARSSLGRAGGDKGYQGVRRRAHKIGPVTIKGRKILGRLPGAIDVIAERKRIIARSRVPWSDAHQKGAVVGRGSRLPAREFLWASSKLLRAIVDRIGGHLQRAWRP